VQGLDTAVTRLPYWREFWLMIWLC